MKSTTPMSADTALAAAAQGASADAIAKASRPAPPPKALPERTAKGSPTHPRLEKAPPPAPQ